MLWSQNARVLEAVFAQPVRSSIRWADIETLFRALGAEVREGAGSWVVVALGDKVAVFHRPHPRPETDRGAVVAVRKFLMDAGIEP